MEPPWIGNPDRCAAALSRGTGYHNLTPNRDGAQADDDPEADRRIPRL